MYGVCGTPTSHHRPLLAAKKKAKEAKTQGKRSDPTELGELQLRCSVTPLKPLKQEADRDGDTVADAAGAAKNGSDTSGAGV